ncbi:hypothetical protein ACTXGO_08585 [Psychrobacter sp. T6-1]|uniref:hypothetical protein n=1 Tax=Psychrobacter sp. T6-1 TaxID=3457447 RepID=UPI003FD47428
MSYSSLPLSSKLFKFTSLTCALALAGCGGGGGDTVDSIAPEYDGSNGGQTGGNNGGNNGGGEQVPEVEADFFLQKLTVNPTIVTLSDEETVFNVAVKAAEVSSGGAVVGKPVSLKVTDSEGNGITIEGQSIQTTDSDGNASYTLKLNPQAVVDRSALIANGFVLVATAQKANGTSVSQELRVSVSVEGSGGTQVTESKLDIQPTLSTSSVSNNILNPYGDNAEFTVIAKDNNGARVQGVTVGLGIASVKGISIIGGNNKTTNASGAAIFNIKIDENLTETERNKLMQGIAYAISIQEQNGATKAVTGNFNVALPFSDYALNVQGQNTVLNAYGDRQTLTIVAAAKNNQVQTTINGAKAIIKLNNPIDGVTLSSEALTLDNNGRAVVDLSIASTLSADDRQKLVEQGVSYTVTLSEPNKSVTTKTYKNIVELPAAKNIVSFENSTKKQISSSGGVAVISFRINAVGGGTVANQPVIASLPIELANNGLLTLDGSAEKTTDNRGIVSYTVRVPAGLTSVQKALLEQSNNFALSVRAVEASGASSVASSESIVIGSDVGRSDIQLSSSNMPRNVSVTDEQFTVQISAKRINGSAATNKSVKLVLSNVAGISIQSGNQQATDAAGNAVFTLNISQNLTQAQREALVASGIDYTAILTDDDGTEAKIVNIINIVKPATSIDFASTLTPAVSELGGRGSISVKLQTKSASPQPVEAKIVDIQLGAKALDYGISVNQTSATTDFSGETTFIVVIPEGLTAQQRDELKSTGINYQISYVENGITYKSDVKKVNITTPVIALNILNAPNNIDNRAGYILNSAGATTNIQAQLNNQSNNSQVTNQSVKMRFDNASLASLLTVNGQTGSAVITATTDADGTVSFDVVVPNNLTNAQKTALSNQVLTATLEETVTGKKQQVKVKVQSMAASISLLANIPNSLNLNGGQTQIEVIAKDNQDNTVTGQKVFFALPAAIASQGVALVSSGSQTTDNSGRATFTIAVPNNLTNDQKAAIGSSFTIALSAADASGNIVTQARTVNTVMPTGTVEALTIGANKVVNTSGDTFKVFVRLTDDDGSIADREVRLNVNDPIRTGVSISNGTAITNNDGVATFDLTLEDGANVNQAILEAGIRLTATTTTAENVKLEQNYIVAVDTTTIDSYQILVSSDKPTLTTGGDQTNATFRVTDSSGGVLSGVPVQLSIEGLEASGAALTTPSLATTDVEGKIDVGVLLAANTVNARLNHNIVINAKIVTPQYDANGDVTLQVREEKSLNLSAVGTEISIVSSTTNLKDDETTTITTTLVDGSGLAINNAGVELIDANGTIIEASAIATTDANGQAIFEIAENELDFDNNGNLRIFARAFGENRLNTQRSLNSVDLVKVSQAGISFIDIEDVYDVNTPQTITVQIRRDTAAQASALIGKQVEVQTTIGTFASSNDVIVTRPITTANIMGNIITVPVTLTSSLAGITALQATVLGETLPNGEPRFRATVDARFRATTPAKMLFQAVRSVITPGGSTEVVATVKDRNDVPVEGQTVVFSRASDSSAGRLSAATAVTNSRGEARVVYQANASSPINGVIINARLLQNNAGIGTKTTNITVSEDAVYTTLAFANKLSSDDIYYTVRGSISVMDGSGRAVPNKEVSIKSYATAYAQGRVCLLDSTVTYQAADNTDADGNVTTPAPVSFTEQEPVFLESNFISTEDLNYNFTLDQDEDVNQNNQLDPINPVAIIGGTLADNEYSFITNDEGRADFEIRYPLRYSRWVTVGFDATTFVNGSENTQTINYRLPVLVGDVSVSDSTLLTPWNNNASPFGTGGATCADSLSVSINENKNSTSVFITPYQNYSVSINTQTGSSSSTSDDGFYFVNFNQAFDLGSTISVTSNGVGFTKTLNIE